MSNGRYERQLANYLDEMDYHVIRAPASGAATKRSLPDLFWSKSNESAIAAELKTTSKDMAYYTSEEVKSLNEFAAAFNAHPRLVARFKGDTSYYIADPKDVYKTPESNYRMTVDEAVRTIDP